jgi:hypothetical protein
MSTGWNGAKNAGCMRGMISIARQRKGVLNSRTGLLRLWPRGRRRGSEMRIFVASILVLTVLYFWDKDYNNGKLVDGLEGMRRSIAHHVFH